MEKYITKSSSTKEDKFELELEIPVISIQASVITKINLALQQNAFPVIRDIEIKNETVDQLSDIELTVTSTPGFIIERTWPIDRLAEKSQLILDDSRIELNSEYLRKITESLNGELTFILKKGNEVLNTCTKNVQLLAKEEWGGVGSLPEILAAFVQPNDPAVQGILRDASKLLQASGKSKALDGYQSNSPKRVATIVSAIWSAVCKLDLTYANPPASFENEGQKVRLPSKIIETRLATCLDTALLFASCLEQVGLNSVVIITEGHAFTGCWLADEDFSSTVIYEAQPLRKRIQLKEIIVFETTLSTNTPPAKFSLASQEGKNKLENDAEFILAVDIKRSRLSSIKPLSDKDLIGNIKFDVQVDEVEIAIDIPEDLPEKSYVTEPTEPVVASTSEARVENWKRQLLDLTMRNRLLNFTSRSRSIQLECYEPGKLEDCLSDGVEFKVTSAEAQKLENDPRSEKIHLQQQNENLRVERVRRLLDKKELVAKQEKNKLEGDLLELYRQGRAAIQEGGTNILYIAIGFLKWQQPNQPERTYKAPLILIPIELTRKSVNSGFKLQLHDDEPRFNPTLLQMLKQDFGLDIAELAGELPTDDHGLDVEGIWNIVRREVRDIEGWEVEESAVISTFSFSKYLMWMDLCERVDDLKNSPVVKHLIDSPRDSYTGGSNSAFPDERKLDQEKHPKDTYTSMLADSSQMAAIYAAEEGKDFVLIGPPGTGKSQTITNMISQLLATGKTVLFVSEKTAALEVVYRRLQEVGLGVHCLELHSAKAKKTEVINQLGEAWEGKGASTSNWQREADRLAKLREGLNSYVKQLHHEFPNGLTPHQAMGVIIRDTGVPKVDLKWTRPDEHDLDAFEKLQDIAKRIDINAAELEGIDDNPLAEIATGEWSPTWQSELLVLAGKLKQQSAQLESAHVSYLAAMKLNVVAKTYSQLQALKVIAETLPEAYAETYQFGFSAQGGVVRKELLELVELIKQYNSVMDKTSCEYKRNVFELPLADFKTQWINSEEKWFLTQWLDRRKIKNPLKLNLSSGEPGEGVLADIELLIEANTLKEKIEKYKYLSNEIGKYWGGLDSDTTWIIKACDWLDIILSAISNTSDDPDEALDVKQRIASLIENQNEQLEKTAPISAKGVSYITQFDEYEKLMPELQVAISYSDSNVFDTKGNVNYYQEVNAVCDRWLSNAKKLRYWCAWRKVRQEAVTVGLAPLVDAIEKSTIKDFSAEQLLLVNFSRWWVNVVVDNDEALRNFIPAEHRLRIEEFHKLDEEFMKLTKQYVKAKLSANIPDRKNVEKKSEWGVLAREIQKKSRHMPLRQLISKMPEALTKLTPCVMMSPMSISQYLPSDCKAFDVVIFDEASQITVCDAIGAIARAKQSIVVGDPKQLPPTAFFGRRADSDDLQDDDFDEDLESILDECLAANIPHMKLNWHYRSKCESLITFSNHRYYNGTLITFPNTDTTGMSVHYHPVDSVYKEGKNRINRGEAEAIVEEVVTKLRDPNFNKSIGVVTFNSEQQKLISNMFEVERGKYEEIEHHFAEDNFESVFVKNIESVQGDERDLIYFSITFGKDAAGKLSMNFGPMNKSGGTRRLNVAISRAKEEMHIFSSLKPEQIDLSRTASEGVRDLKHFLEYAQRGTRALVEAADAPGGYFDSPFEQAVAERLESRGWQTHSQVGVSGFRIDLGIVNPDAPGKYLSAVECDGATYHRSATARDRDFLREKVLRGLGWEVLRIWSTDWWMDSASALDRVDKKLHELLQIYRIENEIKSDNKNISADELKEDTVI